MIFEEPDEHRDAALGWSEPSVHWLEQSTWPEAITARRNVNQWYQDFPDPDGAFAKRLHSTVDIDHWQALDELFVHALLRQTHEDVRYEEGGVGPDFRIYECERLIGSVEVASLFQQSDWNDQQNPHARLADEVNKRLRPTAGYFVDFQIEQASKQIAPTRFVRWLRQQLDTLPAHDQVLTAPGATGELPTARYVGDGVQIRVRFVPMRAGAAALTDESARIVGTGPAVGGWVKAASRLKDRVAAKAGGRYDLRGMPFLVVVGNHDWMCSDEELVGALLGGEGSTSCPVRWCPETMACSPQFPPAGNPGTRGCLL